MLKKIGRNTIKYRNIVLLVFAIVFAISIVGTVFLVVNENKINSDMVSYLDDDSQTKRGLVFLKEQFDIRGNATVIVRVDENSAEDGQKFRGAIENVKKLKGVTSVTWYGAVESFYSLQNDFDEILKFLDENKQNLVDLFDKLADTSLGENIDDIKALLALTDYYGKDFIKTGDLESYLRHETKTEGVYDYVVLVLTDIDAGNNAYALLDGIKSEFSYTSYAATGTTETAKQLLDDTMKSLPWFIVWGIASVLIILFFTTKSYLEPLLLVFTLVVGIVISMGMNYIFPSISIISFAVSAVLQLAITMDYAIFYMHIYRRNRQTMSLEETCENTFPEVTGNVLASGLTTIGGFLALYAMKFKIGTDIANVLVKGVLMSMITVLFVQPVLTYMLDSKIKKTEHNLLQKIQTKANASREQKGKKAVTVSADTVTLPIAKFSVWARIVLVILAVCVAVPSFMASSKLPYSYLDLYEKDASTEESILANELGNQLILAVPLKVVKKNFSQKGFIEEIKNVDRERITGVLGAFTAVDIDDDLMGKVIDVGVKYRYKIKDIKSYLNGSALDKLLGEDFDEEEKALLTEAVEKLSSFTDNVDLGTLESYFREVDGNWYTLYTISFSGNTEDAQAQEAYKKILAVCDQYFGANEYYPVGMITSSYEMASITPRDFLVVTLVSVAIILVIVSVLLRNPLKSLLVVLIIELGISINLAITYLMGQSINFIVYIIISSVELGCTVDYAILFANTFEKNRENYATGKECAIATCKDTVTPVITSGLLISAVCLGMYVISNNVIIEQLTSTLARGAAISVVLVIFLQTAVWSFFKTERKQRNYEEKLAMLENENSQEKGSENSPATGKTKRKKLTAAEKLALLEKRENNTEKK